MLRVEKFRLVDNAGGSDSFSGSGGGGLAELGIILVAAATIAAIDAVSGPDAPRYGFVYTLQMHDGSSLRLLQTDIDDMPNPANAGFGPGALIAIEHLHANQPDLSCATAFPADNGRHKQPTLHVAGAASCGKLLRTEPGSANSH